MSAGLRTESNWASCRGATPSKRGSPIWESCLIPRPRRTRLSPASKISPTKKREIYDEDLVALAGQTADADAWRLARFESRAQNGKRPRMTIALANGGGEQEAESDGDGQVDAAFRAIDKIVANEAALDLFSVRAITGGSDAQGEVTVRLSENGALATGHGADTDIVVASIKAYLDALSRLRDAGRRLHPQRGM